MIGPGQNGFHFTNAGILTSAPNKSGVYVIFNPQTWIYVGESGDIQGRLIQHLNGDNQRITRCAPAGFQFELFPAEQRVARQNQLILQLDPVCNRRLG